MYIGQCTDLHTAISFKERIIKFGKERRTCPQNCKSGGGFKTECGVFKISVKKNRERIDVPFHLHAHTGQG